MGTDLITHDYNWLTEFKRDSASQSYSVYAIPILFMDLGIFKYNFWNRQKKKTHSQCMRITAWFLPKTAFSLCDAHACSGAAGRTHLYT